MNQPVEALHKITEDQSTGCLLGLALGDALGAPYEGGMLERMVWRCIGTTKAGAMRWTDDTRMSLDLAESLVSCGRLDTDDVAQRFAQSYQWSRGYGPGTARLLKKIRAGMPWRDANRLVHPNGSFGNGAAMRAPVIGVAFVNEPSQLASAARLSAQITHAHPLGTEGAVLVAAATADALRGIDPPAILAGAAAHASQPEFMSRLSRARQWIDSHANCSPPDVCKELGMSMTAQGSCVTAIYLAARFMDQPFTSLIDFITRGRGDIDTIAAMAGAIWAARNGASRLPASAIANLENANHIRDIADRLYHAFISPNQSSQG